MNDPSKPLVIKGRAIREDVHGNVCLDDIWKVSGESVGRIPREWRKTITAKRLILRLAEIRGVAPGNGKKQGISIIYAKTGRGGGTFADPVIAAAYAGYLNTDLEIEVREVWLRYRAADPALADDILRRASAEANEWAGVRALGRAQRKDFTDALMAAGVTAGKGFGWCTNAIYRGLFKLDANGIRIAKSLSVKANIRDNMSITELSQLMLSEGMAAERIEEEGCQGDKECAEASKISATFIRQAVEAERASRQKRRFV